MDITKIDFMRVSIADLTALRDHYGLPEPTTIEHVAYYPLAIVDNLCEDLAKAQITIAKLKAELEQVGV